jgi:hypothetical protein
MFFFFFGQAQTQKAGQKGRIREDLGLLLEEREVVLFAEALTIDDLHGDLYATPLALPHLREVACRLRQPSDRQRGAIRTETLII